MSNKALSWRVGGPQGSGVDTAATFFARACGLGGFHMFGRREYYSNIMGRHSYYDVRIAHRPLTTFTDTVDFLVTFDAETLVRHAQVVVANGAIVYAVSDADTPMDRVKFLDEPVKDELETYLEKRGLPTTAAGVIEDAQQRGVNVFPVDFDELTENLAEDQDIGINLAGRALNTNAVAVSCALLGYDQQYLARALERVFAGKQRVIDMNVRAVALAYEWVEANLEGEKLHMTLEPQETSEKRMYLNANHSVALGKVAAGMGFQTYYPISPATDESVYLEGNETFPAGEEDGSVVIVQTEDELAAITMASGAALSGVRSATATSGPGFSLMVEGLGWASTNEVPVVITLYQRGSPSTGMPTRTEQGDLRFALHGGHGESPRILLASGDVSEAFYDAAQAFNYAERYQMPVIHLLDKGLASMSITRPPFEVDRVKIERGVVRPPQNEEMADVPYDRFEPTETGITPRAYLGQPGGIHWMTGGEHDYSGHVTEDPDIRDEMMEKRARKLELAAREIPFDEKITVHGDPDAALTILSWGSTKGGLLEALERLEADGVAARFVQVRLLWPFPGEELVGLLSESAPLIVVEANFSGQLNGILREQTGIVSDHLLVKYNGRPLSGQELHKVLTMVHEGKADRKVVLRHATG